MDNRRGLDFFLTNSKILWKKDNLFTKNPVNNIKFNFFNFVSGTGGYYSDKCAGYNIFIRIQDYLFFHNKSCN